MVVATKAPVKAAALSTTTSAPKKVTSDDKNGRVATEEDFEFYARLAKLMILRKDNTEVTSKYSTWLKSLRNHENINTGVDYVRLMVMALQHPEPVCPFNDYPPADIDPLDCDPMEKARRILRQQDGVSCVPPFLNPPVVSAVSEDRRQYAAYQTVPNAGVQCYYVRADEPMSGWNFPSTISKPDNPMHAGSLDWERSLAGILKKPRSIQNGTETSLESFVNSGSKAKYTFKDSTNACKILNVLQEGIDVGDGVFKWSEYSLLTGDTIPGSDLCIDWMVHEHERTQLEIDEEIINSFDKLYPGNFRLSACPELLEGIYRKFQCAQENVLWTDDKKNGTPPRQCGGGSDPVRPLMCSEPPKRNSRFYGDDSIPGSEKFDLYTVTTTAGYSTNPSAESFISSLKTFNAADDVENVYPDMESPLELLSFTEAAKCFADVANKAENTLREVNTWLKYKEEQRRNDGRSPY